MAVLKKPPASEQRSVPLAKPASGLAYIKKENDFCLSDAPVFLGIINNHKFNLEIELHGKTAMDVLFKLLWYALAYVLGSIPFGLVLGRVFCKMDIRRAGSGNVGATNVARLCGTGWGVLTLLLDAAKGAAPVAVALYALPLYWPEIFPAKSAAGMAAFTALAALLGHVYSIFLKFKGGKAVATTVGIYLVLLPIHLIIAAVLCIVVIKRWGFVSLGSITLVSAMPVLLVFSGMFTRNFDYFLLSVCIAVLVVYNHRGNMMRLLAGDEKPWQKRDLPPAAEPGPEAPPIPDAALAQENTAEPAPAPQAPDTSRAASSANACPPPEHISPQGLKGV